MGQSNGNASRHRHIVTWTIIAFGAILSVALILTIRSIASIANSVDRVSDEVRLLSAADLGHRHIEVRTIAIRSQSAQAKDAIALIGDSITELALLPSRICGHEVVNAGIGGLDVSSYLRQLPKLFETNRPAAIVIALGTNDAQIASRHEPSFEGRYSELINAASMISPRIIIAGLPPIERGALSDVYFDSNAALAIDAKIREAANRRSIPFIDLRSAMTQEHLTNDGIHLTSSGYRVWMNAIERGVEAALGCEGSKL